MDKVRAIPLGPKAVAVVEEFLGPDPDAHLLDPREAVAERHTRRLGARILMAEQAAEILAWSKAHRWSPNRVRHAAATAIRAKYGLEAAQVILGHARADVSQLCAARDEAKAQAIMREIG